jgi:hypothetical protein
VNYLTRDEPRDALGRAFGVRGVADGTITVW